MLSIQRSMPADQAEGLPAESSARTRHEWMPSPRPGGVQLPTSFWCMPATVALRMTVVQAFVVQTSKSSEPVSPPAVESVYVAARVGVRSRSTPSAGVEPAGPDGGVVSSVKLEVADQPDWLPTASCAPTRQ